ncbi:hypothetical protein EPI10_016045 [Gossypium australe]|uniref:Uncharacterized protein n=1 Tax=Gossypium australe TaxID=47621 RepID=A0A5B6VMJ0_9ROSI|nr:hypothetical protein EPI10_016045 [Gossypium australe]
MVVCYSEVEYVNSEEFKTGVRRPCEMGHTRGVRSCGHTRPYPYPVYNNLDILFVSHSLGTRPCSLPVVNIDHLTRPKHARVASPWSILT